MLDFVAKRSPANPSRALDSRRGSCIRRGPVLVGWMLGILLTIGCGGDTAGGDSSGGSGGSATGGSSMGGSSMGGSAGSGATGGSTGGGGGSTSQYRQCMDSSDCAVVSETCCGNCGQASRGDAIAVNVDQVGRYSSELACGGEPGTCPACAAPPDPSLLATCQQGLCTVTDLLVQNFNECSSDSDCRLRSRDCCECGGADGVGDLIAVSQGSAEYDSLVCAPGTGCPECLPNYDPRARPWCDQGHCAVEWALD